MISTPIKYRLFTLLFVVIALFVPFSELFSQQAFSCFGKITDENKAPLQNVTVHSVNPPVNVLTQKDGSFVFSVDTKPDSLTISCIGYGTLKIKYEEDSINGLNIQLKHETKNLEAVVVGAKGRINNYLIRKVIENKLQNDPARYNAYSYQRYTRNELGFDNIDFTKDEGKGLKSLMMKTYEHFDTTAKDNKELPLYFNEKIFNVHHSVSPKIEDEVLIAEKNLGLKTDEMIKDLYKFYLHFNVYEDWIGVFDQSYISPLNPNGLNYYKYLVGDTLIDKNDTIIQISFIPLRNYEKAFRGNLWVNASNFAVVNVNMRLNKTANLNFVSDINYNEEYKYVYDSSKSDFVYMPFKYSSDVKFESGLSLLGIPQKNTKKRVSFVIKNTTVSDKINLTDKYEKKSAKEKKQEEAEVVVNNSEEFWKNNRPDSLTNQEKIIYAMIDSLKGNQKFNTNIKMISLVGSGFWDIKNKIRLGPSSSLISTNNLEGYRFRAGFWTMPGISKKFNLNAYLAYGTKDKAWKGKAGIKYIWNQVRWTKTSLSYSADFDLLNINADELDDDNIVSSFSRKNIPFTRLFIKNAELKHEQFINSNWSLNSSLNYKEIKPTFDFKYLPLNKPITNTNDSGYLTTIPVAELGIGLRYAHKEATTIFNYENLKLTTYFPIISANYIHGFRLNNNMFNYDKFIVSVQQWLRLPPKFLLYYKVEGGKINKTLPYLLLNIPAGNQYFVASKYVFNTMNPYEFSADKYVSLQTRLHLGGILFEKIPFIQKLGWRERFSFNAYLGDMTAVNQLYNKSTHFYIANKKPFMEASAGVENIFHFLSIEYFKRLSYLGNPSITKSGLFFGVTIVF